MKKRGVKKSLEKSQNVLEQKRENEQSKNLHEKDQQFFLELQFNGEQLKLRAAFESPQMHIIRSLNEIIFTLIFFNPHCYLKKRPIISALRICYQRSLSHFCTPRASCFNVCSTD